MNQASAQEWLQIIEEHEDHAGDGKWLEKLVCDIGHQVPEWDLKQAVMWENWEDRTKIFPGSSSQDLGIDCVGIRNDGELVAIQCKARKQNSDLSKKEIDSFGFSAQSKKWKERWVVSNAYFGNNLQKSLQTNDLSLRLVDFVEPVRRLASDREEVPEDNQLTEMQNECVRKVVNGLKDWAEHGRKKWNRGESRGHIVLPCGTGKTRVAYRVMKELVQPGELAVVLVPSIALVSQIKRQFQTLAKRDNLEISTLAVCSDATAGGKKRVSEDQSSLETNPTLDISHTHSFELVGDTATDESQVIDWLKAPPPPARGFNYFFPPTNQHTTLLQGCVSLV